MKILPSDNSYKTFCDLTGGYRMVHVMMEAVRSGIIDRLENGECSPDELLQSTNLQTPEGRRFIESLVNIGLLERYDEKLYLSRFSRSYLGSAGETSQRHVLKFEPILMEKWRQLGTVLEQGQGALISEQSPEEYTRRLQLYQQAMGEAAIIRSRELWESIPHLPERGTIIDIGAGDGTYLIEFLHRHPLWFGVACDLPDVCARLEQRTSAKNLSIVPCNILNQQELSCVVDTYRARADILLFSNICHCYGPDENSALLRQAAELSATDGLLIVHDFFRDANSFGALYDLHMLVNTPGTDAATLPPRPPPCWEVQVSHTRQQLNSPLPPWP